MLSIWRDTTATLRMTGRCASLCQKLLVLSGSVPRLLDSALNGGLSHSWEGWPYLAFVLDAFSR